MGNQNASPLGPTSEYLYSILGNVKCTDVKNIPCATRRNETRGNFQTKYVSGMSCLWVKNQRNITPSVYDLPSRHFRDPPLPQRVSDVRARRVMELKIDPTRILSERRPIPPSANYRKMHFLTRRLRFCGPPCTMDIPATSKSTSCYRDMCAILASHSTNDRNVEPNADLSERPTLPD